MILVFHDSTRKVIRHPDVEDGPKLVCEKIYEMRVRTHVFTAAIFLRNRKDLILSLPKELQLYLRPGISEGPSTRRTRSGCEILS